MERSMSQLTIPENVLWNPIISAVISRYLSEKDRLNCKSLIPTWDRLTTRTLALSPTSWGRQAQLFALLQNASLGFDISSLDFSAERGKHVVQLLFLLAGPAGTGLVNVTTLDIMNQPISIAQMNELFVNYPMPRLRVLSLTVVEANWASRCRESLHSELKLEDVTICGKLSQREKLLLTRCFGNTVRNMSLDDSSHHAHGMPRLRTCRWEEDCPTWIPASWTSLQIHHDSDVLDVLLNGKNCQELPNLTLLTEPGHFLPARYITNSSSSSILPRMVKYRTLKQPPFDIPQLCRACASAEDRRRMPRLQCPDLEALDGEAPVNFVACSLMSVEDNCLLRPLNLHDLYLHINPVGTNSSPTHPFGRRASVRCAVEALIQKHYCEIEHLSIRLCQHGSDKITARCVQELPYLVKDYFLLVLETCASSIRCLEVSAEIIWACCSCTLVRKRLLRLHGLNVRKATISDDLDFAQQLHPAAGDISTYLSLFPALEELHIIAVDIFRDPQTLHELLTACGRLRRLYAFSRQQTANFQYAALPQHSALELLFLEINELTGKIDFRVLLNRTLANLHALKYLLLKFDNGRYPPTVTSLKVFFAEMVELRWLVVVLNETHNVLLCHADGGDSRADPKIFKANPRQLAELISTYPELYDIFWSEFKAFSSFPL